VGGPHRQSPALEGRLGGHGAGQDGEAPPPQQGQEQAQAKEQAQEQGGVQGDEPVPEALAARGFCQDQRHRAPGVSVAQLAHVPGYEQLASAQRASGAGRPVSFLPSNIRTKPADLDPTYTFPAGFAPGYAHEYKTKFTATDPGVTSPFTKAWHNPWLGRLQTQSLTSKQYRHDAGTFKMNKRVANERKRFALDPIIAKFALHSFKQTDVDGALHAAHLRLQHHDLMHGAYSRRQKLKLRFECKRRSMRANDKAVNFLRHNRDVELVVVGDAGRPYGLKGTSGQAPVKKIKRIAVRRGRNEGFVVADFNEACISAKSWCCHGHRTKKMPDHNSPRLDGKPRKSEVYGILICEGCGKLWARGAYAALNIWTAASHQILGMDRPLWLRTWHANAWHAHAGLM
jgi:hypothetical protein